MNFNRNSTTYTHSHNPSSIIDETDQHILSYTRKNGIHRDASFFAFHLLFIITKSRALAAAAESPSNNRNSSSRCSMVFGSFFLATFFLRSPNWCICLVISLFLLVHSLFCLLACLLASSAAFALIWCAKTWALCTLITFPIFGMAHTIYSNWQTKDFVCNQMVLDQCTERKINREGAEKETWCPSYVSAERELTLNISVLRFQLLFTTIFFSRSQALT